MNLFDELNDNAWKTLNAALGIEGESLSENEEGAVSLGVVAGVNAALSWMLDKINEDKLTWHGSIEELLNGA